MTHPPSTKLRTITYSRLKKKRARASPRSGERLRSSATPVVLKLLVSSAGPASAHPGNHPRRNAMRTPPTSAQTRPPHPSARAVSRCNPAKIQLSPIRTANQRRNSTALRSPAPSPDSTGTKRPRIPKAMRRVAPRSPRNSMNDSSQHGQNACDMIRYPATKALTRGAACFPNRPGQRFINNSIYLKLVHTDTAALHWRLLLHHLTGLRRNEPKGPRRGPRFMGDRPLKNHYGRLILVEVLRRGQEGATCRPGSGQVTCSVTSILSRSLPGLKSDQPLPIIRSRD